MHHQAEDARTLGRQTACPSGARRREALDRARDPEKPLVHCEAPDQRSQDELRKAPTLAFGKLPPVHRRHRQRVVVPTPASLQARRATNVRGMSCRPLARARRFRNASTLSSPDEQRAQAWRPSSRSIRSSEACTYARWTGPDSMPRCYRAAAGLISPNKGIPDHIVRQLAVVIAASDKLADEALNGRISLDSGLGAGAFLRGPIEQRWNHLARETSELRESIRSETSVLKLVAQRNRKSHEQDRPAGAICSFANVRPAAQLRLAAADRR